MVNFLAKFYKTLNTIVDYREIGNNSWFCIEYFILHFDVFYFKIYIYWIFLISLYFIFDILSCLNSYWNPNFAEYVVHLWAFSSPYLRLQCFICFKFVSIRIYWAGSNTKKRRRNFRVYSLYYLFISIIALHRNGIFLKYIYRTVRTR